MAAKLLDEAACSTADTSIEQPKKQTYLRRATANAVADCCRMEA